MRRSVGLEKKEYKEGETEFMGTGGRGDGRENKSCRTMKTVVMI